MNDRLPMLFVTALVLVASAALARQFQLEREDDAARPYLGPPVEDLHARNGGLLDRITRPRVLAVRSATLRAGDVRMIASSVPPSARRVTPSFAASETGR